MYGSVVQNTVITVTMTTLILIALAMRTAVYYRLLDLKLEVSLADAYSWFRRHKLKEIVQEASQQDEELVRLWCRHRVAVLTAYCGAAACVVVSVI